MLHKVFNEKEEMQWHRRETKKHICRVQGGTENGPFPKDKLHTKRLPFPILLYLVTIPAQQEQSLTPAPSLPPSAGGSAKQKRTSAVSRSSEQSKARGGTARPALQRGAAGTGPSCQVG